MREIVVKLLKKVVKDELDIEELIEKPKDDSLGDYAFPCFALAKFMKKNPVEIAKELASKIIKTEEIEKVQASGPYVNFFVSRKMLASGTILEVKKKRDKYGSSKIGAEKVVVIDMSSPNIAKPFGIGHLRSTIIGNSIAKTLSFSGYKVKKLNYLGDWGTPFGKIIAGYKEFGNSKLLKKEPLKHLLEVYVKASSDERFDELGRNWFRKMEQGDKEALKIWAEFRKLSLDEFKKIYKLLNVKFDVFSGESEYNSKMDSTIGLLKKKSLLELSDGAWVVNLERYNLGVCLIKKADGGTLYATRDITAAIDRHNRFGADYLLYEVGAEQKLHFRQFFKVLELLGFNWAAKCVHIDHGLYLDGDGKKFATRKGKTVFMKDILEETANLAKKEILKREKISDKELERRALAIARAAIFYGDLKNNRSTDVVFDIDRFVSFEGDTGPYLLYSYARAKNILKKNKGKKMIITGVNDSEKKVVSEIARFPEVVRQSSLDYSPNLIAHYAYDLSQTFNEFYHSCKVIGSAEENFRLTLVEAFAQTLKNALGLLGIDVIERM
ncbi:MAG: arginine--tRNA ligase [Nanoarchaeota archaeon]